MNNLDYVYPESLISIAPRLLYAAIIRTSIDKLRMLFILGRAAWAGWPGRDLHLPCARLNREIPPSASSPKKANWENRHISSIVHDVFYV